MPTHMTIGFIDDDRQSGTNRLMDGFEGLPFIKDSHNLLSASWEQKDLPGGSTIIKSIILVTLRAGRKEFQAARAELLAIAAQCGYKQSPDTAKNARHIELALT